MSFIYAEKVNDSLNIFSDTKIGFKDDIGLSYSKEQAELVRTFGIVKTIILSPEFSISFAGNNISLASKLCLMLRDKREFTTQEALDIAFYIHNNAKENDIEFIIASCKNHTLSLNCIKNHELSKDVQIAWIGSKEAHREFQKLRNENNKGLASNRTSTAFLEVVNGCKDDTVGGFPISARYNAYTNTITYSECCTIQSSKSQTVKAGEAFKFFLANEDGGFSYQQIPLSVEEVILSIDQMDKNILYSRCQRGNAEDQKDDKLFGMMLPMLIEKKERLDWIQYG